MLTDSYGRKIKDLRVSLTDRCNFRCFYCLPQSQPTLANKQKILTFEEIAEICRIFVSLGIEKIRLTGGEPMLRRNIEDLIKKIALLKNAKSSDSRQCLKDLALTTNGFSLSERAAGLKKAGLDRVTISLDSLKSKNFRKITGVGKLSEVLEAIEAAKKADLKPIKINAVIVRGWNDNELVDFARFARENDLAMRFIEYMPLDARHEWQREQVVSGREIFTKINEVFPLVLKEKSRGSGTAWKYEFKDGAKGEIGIIAPVTEMFCGACSRIRLTADGQIRTCLFSVREHNLRDLLRSGAGQVEIIEFIRRVVFQKEPHHYINETNFVPASRSMSFIGG
jgi:cyclic pyranopterin phosphate synthase